MNIRQLQYFVLLAKELHFALAASKLGITQPPLTRSIQNLEKELGVALFLRSNKWKIELTPAGKAFLPEAERILNQLQYAKTAALAAGQGFAGHLTVGAISSMIGNAAFIDTLADMQKHYPSAVVEIVDSTSGDLLQQIRSRSVDLALLRLPPDHEDPDMTVRHLFDDEISLVFANNHRLASKKEIRVSDLAGEPLILVPERPSAVFRSYILAFCRIRGGFTPIISKEISNSYTALRLTAAGVGITMVSSAYEGIFSDRLCYRHFAGFRPVLPMYALHPADHTPPLMQVFLRTLTSHLDAKMSETAG